MKNLLTIIIAGPSPNIYFLPETKTTVITDSDPDLVECSKIEIPAVKVNDGEVEMVTLSLLRTDDLSDRIELDSMKTIVYITKGPGMFHVVLHLAW